MREGSGEIIRKIVSKYYDITAVTETDGALIIKVSDLDLNPEDYFSRMVAELDASGYTGFTTGNLKDEITVIEKPASNENSWIKVILFAATIASTGYFGYLYQASYSSGAGLSGTIFSDIVFYLLPLSVIFAAREAGKYVALKRNRMSYSFPIFVPDPLGIGTMGMINSPSKPFTSRKAMIESGSYSLIFGLVISVIFYIFGSLLTFYFPPSSSAINSPVDRIGSPILLQIISLRMIPSNGILDPLALAGWAGLVITAFNALPLGFLDGGLISSALLGRRSVYLSYVSILAILGLGIIYPSWIVLAVFALLVGLRGPQPLNNRFRLNTNTKVLAAVAFSIIIVGIAPIPFQTSLNSFTASASQYNFVAYGQNATVAVTLNITDTGSSAIVPAFDITPSVSFTLSGRSKSILPGQSINYTMEIDTKGTMKLGYNPFSISVYSGSVSKTLDVNVLYVNLSPAFTFNNQNPMSMSVNESSIFSLYLNVSRATNITVISIVNPQLNYTYLIESQSVPGEKSVNASIVTILPFSSESLLSGSSEKLSFQMPHIPISWIIVAYNTTYSAAVANIQVVP